ncbi:MAG: 2-C-methyl-D-erythritol 4-phosphate cytidylyltransferase [Magnetococcales bacterium]|nr:2-C-methyl-D-erythritol 4-phosphate cytidylyltransferase [Magnetococcales bacterium]MBF0150922.1 2-C-methyl-D-erythritol 4-phosphate cytidylyltransferase [Magnetococcales bacterium]MBF0347470.1 2-C-methyl-D-erythritol 4-phosphate cytidylyltransferase [Magnetococcales bacterium]MBF0631437.1 2-C-methyl-D-erythritol 4-phosphate cytidylyltransferase [Magnetococcales bacterium]
MTLDLPLTMIVVAAGSGQRFGGPRPKQYLDLAGRPVVFHTLHSFHEHPNIKAILPVIAADGHELWHHCLDPHLSELPRVLSPVTGGATRQESVWRGLSALDLPADAWVGIHDAARPFPGKKLLERLLEARNENMALIAALPASDTVKRVDPQRNIILETLNRSHLWLAQTPQLFHHGPILQLHQRARAAGFEATDDASLAEWGGLEVRVVPGDPRNIKITHPRDLELARQWLQEELP